METSNAIYVTDSHETSIVTFRDAAMGWMDEKKRKVKESTFAMYHHSTVRHLLPDLGEVYLSDIDEQFLNQYLDEKLSKNRLRGEGALSPKTMSDIRSILRMILEYASRNGYPHLGTVKLSISSHKPSEMQVLNHEEQRKLVDYLVKHDTPLNLGILLSLFVGVRNGEICGVRWGDIDFHYGMLRIERTVIRIQDVDRSTGSKTKIMITDPKTVNSKRKIPIPGDILSLLETHREDDSCYLLTGTHKMMEPRRLLSKYKKVLREAGIPDFRYHALRHSFATRCVEEDFDVKSLSEIMGHSNVKITMDRYVHPSMDFKKQQMNRLTLH